MKKIYLLGAFLLFIITSFFLGSKVFRKQDYYKSEYLKKTNTYVSSISRPRGKILDCNGNILVDNIGVKTIVYRKTNNINKEEEITIAKKLASLLDIDDEASLLDLKKYWLDLNSNEGKNLITDEEYKLYQERKLTSNDLYLLKLDRVPNYYLENFKEEEKEVALIYSLMNKGYYYDAKVIKKEVSDSEYARVLEEKIKGVTNEMDYKRVYPYGNSLRSILGNIGSIPKEMESYYIENGASLDEYVGISYLEQQYDKYLRGEKDLYLVEEDGTLTLVKNGKRGNDLYLSIDIKMQQDIENILKEEIKNGKKLPNTKYYNGSYVIVSNPLDGSIKAMVGLKYLGNDVFKYVENDCINSSFTVGSIVKGASMALAYQKNLVEVGKKIKDSCVKLYLNPQKCSYKSLGFIDDLSALKTSSNYYQFLLAIKLAGYEYKPNLKMEVSEKEFNIYREAFSYFGLGSLTGIDLPNELTGIKGKTIAPDLLLNFVIGQYDTYTPVSLLQYINTIYNDGVRYSLSLMAKIVSPDGEVLVENKPNILSEFALDKEYFARIKTGFYQVVNEGTGSGYVDKKFRAMGKTGTSQTIYDSDNDGVGDVDVVHNTFAMVAPYDNPKYSMVVISPNVFSAKNSNSSFPYINRYISKSVSDYLFS